MGIKRILCLLLALLTVCSLCACGETSPIAGTWLGTLDYSQILLEEFSNDSLWDDIPIEGICLTIRFDFNADGSFSTQIDKESAGQMVNALLDLAVEGLIRNLEKQGTPLETLDITKEQLRQQLEGKIDLSTLIDPLEFVFGTGYYEYLDGRIYIGSQARSLRANPEENAAEIMTVTLENDTMTVTQLDSQDASAQGLLPGLLPFQLKRQ